MEILAYVLSVAALGVFLYLGFSKNSNPVARRAARITLLLAALSAIVCSILVLGRTAGAAVFSHDPPPPEAVPVPVKPAAVLDFKLLLIIVMLIIGFVALIILAARQEHSKNRKDKSKRCM
jgi:cytochrome bd-type quinol oxidase subunit 2